MRLALVAAVLALSVVGGAVPAAHAAGDSLDFDLLEENKKPVDPVARAEELRKAAALERKVRTRRTMLKLHQAFGFATVAALAATMIVGQLNWQDKYGGGDDSGYLVDAHLGLSVGSTALFATTGLLAIAAPNPYPKPVRFDTALVHKITMGLATVGMLAQIVMGPIVAAREGHLDQRDLANAHLAIGWSTMALTATGVLVYVF